MPPPKWFESETPGFEIQRLKHYGIKDIKKPKIALKTLKKANNFWGFAPGKPTRALPQTPRWSYDRFAIAFLL